MNWRDLECQTINPCICNSLYLHLFLINHYCLLFVCLFVVIENVQLAILNCGRLQPATGNCDHCWQTYAQSHEAVISMRSHKYIASMQPIETFQALHESNPEQQKSRMSALLLTPTLLHCSQYDVLLQICHNNIIQWLQWWLIT